MHPKRSPTATHPLYTADQLRAAIAQEREKIAAWLDWYDGKPTRRGEAVRRGDYDVAAIRGQAEGERG